MDNFLPLRLQSRIGQEGLHNGPTVLVLAGHRQAYSKVVRPVGKVQLVEPIARIKAVPVQRLGPQQVATGVHERHALPQQHGAQAHVLDAHPVGHGGVLGGGVDIDVV